MTNREFDAFVRAQARKEAFCLTNRTEERIRRSIMEPAAKRRVRRFTLRTALIAALVLALLTATALAVANLSGVAELFERMFEKEEAERLRQETSQPVNQAYGLPDAQITLVDVVFDGSTLYAAGHAAPRDPAQAVILPQECSTADAFGYNEGRGETPPEGARTVAETARELGARILRVDVDVTAAQADGIDWTSSDFLINRDGSYDFWYSIPGVTVSEDNAISVTLTGIQWEITDENAEVPDTAHRAEWTLEVPAVAREMATATPKPQATPVPAEKARGALRVLGASGQSTDAMLFAQANPGQTALYLEDGGETAGQSLQATALAGDWDVCWLYWDEGGLMDALMERGMLYDVSQDERIAGRIEAMWPAVREHVSFTGGTYAVPMSVSPQNEVLMSTPGFYDVNAWEQLGFTGEDMPQTLDDLFALAQKYAVVPKEQRKDIIFNPYAYNAHSWLLELTLDMYRQQAMRSGAPLAFQTDVLRGLLERMNAAAAALKGEKDFGNPALDSGTFLQGNQNAVVLRLTPESEPFVPVYGEMLLVNANSPRLEQALAYVRFMLENMGWNERARLDSQISYGELNALALEQEIGERKRMAEWLRTQADEENARAQMEVAEALEARAATANVIEEIYLTDEKDLEAYRSNIAPYLVYLDKKPGYAFADNAAAQKLKNSYLAGRLDTEAFLRGLDELEKE
ncbi:MAG: hypothetical protein MR842_02890 [Clostridiales bacterium]|nr:hypothetical protein [Clostridiales bacterium]